MQCSRLVLDGLEINELAIGNNVRDICYVLQQNAESRGTKFAEQLMQEGSPAMRR
jgi:hypothetical protein